MPDSSAKVNGHNIPKKYQKHPVLLMLGGVFTYTVFYEEGIEGYHKRASESITKQIGDGLERLVYLNYGYFRVKPPFTIVRKQDGTPTTFTFLNSRSLAGYFELQDVKTGVESQLWIYSEGNRYGLWEQIKRDIEHIMIYSQQIGVKLREDGYLPVIIKIGTIPLAVGSRFALAVGFDEKIELDSGTFFDLSTPSAWEHQKLFNPVVNSFEDENGVKFINQAK